MVTQVRLKELFSYDPLTGVFVNLVSSGTRRAGRQAGSKHNAGYVKLFIDGQSHLAHRMAHLYMTGTLPTDHMDHINHIRSDNRWQNLRVVGRTENNRNKRISKRSRTGIPGVAWKERDNCWHVRAYIEGKQFHLGSFHDFFEAVCRRKSSDMHLGYHANNGSPA